MTDTIIEFFSTHTPNGYRAAWARGNETGGFWPPGCARKIGCGLILAATIAHTEAAYVQGACQQTLSERQRAVFPSVSRYMRSKRLSLPDGVHPRTKPGSLAPIVACTLFGDEIELRPDTSITLGERLMEIAEAVETDNFLLNFFENMSGGEGLNELMSAFSRHRDVSRLTEKFAIPDLGNCGNDKPE